MNRPLLPWLLVAALATAVGSVACSTPDVETFEGVNAAASSKDKDKADKKKAGDDDDDDVADPVEDTTPADSTPTETDPPAETDTDPAPTTPAPTLTPVQCQTKCVATQPTAAALDSCVNSCADGDSDCLGNCFIDTGCDVDAACQSKVDECSAKCFP